MDSNNINAAVVSFYFWSFMNTDYPGSPRPNQPKHPRKPRNPRPPRRSRTKRDVPVRLKRPLSSSTTIPGDRFRYYNGNFDSVTSTTSLFGSFNQSAYTNGDRKNPNSYSYTSLRVSTFYGTLSLTYSPYDIYTSVGYQDGFMTPRSFRLNSTYLRDMDQFDRTKRKASEKFYKSLRDSDLNLAVDIAEWKQASGMIASTGNKLAELALKIRKRARVISLIQELIFNKYGNDPRHPEVRRLRRKLPKKHRYYYGGESAVFARTWLEYQYGWRPLLSTLYGLVDLQRNHAKFMRIKGSSKLTNTVTTLEHAGVGLTSVTTITNTSMSQVVCDVAVDSSILNDVSRLTTLNPAAIAWELVPYSFVVDWFFDIGRYLEELESSLAFGVGLRFKRGFTTDVQVTEVSHNVAPQKNGIVEALSQLSHTEKNISFNRVALTSLPYPFFPKFKVKLGFERILSAAALLNGIFFKWGTRSRS